MVMLWQSWGTWPDVLIDFGRELYIPWRLSQGEVLYRDVAHFNGPLSPYFNALLFRLFGVSLRTLVLANLAILAVVLILLYRLLVAVGGRWAATVACLTFVLLFAYSQFTMNGNGNYLCPYSHEVTHGVLFSLVGLTALDAYRRRHRLRAVAVAGLAVGLAFLTKVEVSLAAFLATTAGLGLCVWAESPGARRAAKVAALYVGAMLAAPLAAFVALRTALPAGLALQGTLGSWWYAFNPELSSNPYYRRCLGVLDVEQSLGLLSCWTVRYAAAFVAALALAVYVRRSIRLHRTLAGAVFLLVVTYFGLHWWQVRWEDALRPLPVTMAALSVASGVAFLKQRKDRERAGRIALQLSMALFGFALLLKMLLNVRIYHYGFALAMPAVMMVAVAVFDWVPAWVRRRGGSDLVFQAVMLGLWVVATAVHLYINIAAYWRPKVHVVSSGADAFLADWRGPAVNAALAVIAERLGPEGTLAVFPEGEMLNYLSRRRNPTPFIKFAPPELIMFGQLHMLAAFRAHPPDLILLVDKDTSEYGVPYFGRDYGQELAAWIEANYRPIHQIGAPPLRGEGFGILVLEYVGQN